MFAAKFTGAGSDVLQETSQVESVVKNMRGSKQDRVITGGEGGMVVGF